MSKTIVANWKMNVGVRESVALVRGVLSLSRGKSVLPDVVVCPPFVALGEARKAVARSRVALGAQDVFWENQGAFTGEISPRMLLELGVSYVIIGHSERRMHLGETDEMVNRKFLRTLADGLVPVVCVGETKAERAAGSAQEVVDRQLRAAFKGCRVKNKDRFFVAYEPVWAIGTGEAATPADAVGMHMFIRVSLRKLLPGVRDDRFGVLYGGSADGSNAYSFLRETEVNGLLVGGASVRISQFKEIFDAACEVLEAQP